MARQAIGAGSSERHANKRRAGEAGRHAEQALCPALFANIPRVVKSPARLLSANDMAPDDLPAALMGQG